MTREELKAHCERQVENCEMWAKLKGEEPSGKVYEEHKLILELLEQGSILDKIRTDVLKLDDINPDYPMDRTIHISRDEVLEIIDKYRK